MEIRESQVDLNTKIFSGMGPRLILDMGLCLDLEQQGRIQVENKRLQQLTFYHNYVNNKLPFFLSYSIF